MITRYYFPLVAYPGSCVVLMPHQRVDLTLAGPGYEKGGIDLASSQTHRLEKLSKLNGGKAGTEGDLRIFYPIV